jgi:hypothetical protein
MGAKQEGDREARARRTPGAKQEAGWLIDADPAMPVSAALFVTLYAVRCTFTWGCFQPLQIGLCDTSWLRQPTKIKNSI